MNGESVGTDLRRLAQRLWRPSNDEQWPVEVAFNTVPTGYVPAEEYAVVPNLRSPEIPCAATRTTC